MNYKITFLLFFLPFTSWSQNFFLDSVLVFENPGDKTILSFTSALDNDSGKLFIYPEQNNLSEIIIEIDINSHIINTLNIYYDTRKSSSDSKSSKRLIGASKGYVFLQSSDKTIFIFERKPNELMLYTSIKTEHFFNRLSFSKNHIVNGCLLYNSNPKSKSPRTLCVNFDLMGKIINNYSPNFNGIEFTHFSPSSFIDFDSNFCYFFQTTEPSFEKINLNSLQHENFLIKNIKWKAFTTTGYNKILTKKKYNQFYDIFDSLKDYSAPFGKIDRVQYGFRYSADTILLICNPFKNKFSETEYIYIKRVIIATLSSDRKSYNVILDKEVDLHSTFPKKDAIYPFNKETYLFNKNFITIKLSFGNQVEKSGLEKKSTYYEIGFFNFDF